LQSQHALLGEGYLLADNRLYIEPLYTASLISAPDSRYVLCCLRACVHLHIRHLNRKGILLLTMRSNLQIWGKVSIQHF
jgi:hypothetical protein